MDDLTELAIAELRRDGRASFSDLARRLGTTRAGISNRLTPLLESESLIVAAAVHPGLLGLTVLGHASIHARGRLAEVVEEIRRLEGPVFISETLGAHQLVAELHTRSTDELRRQISAIRELPQVDRVDVLVYERIMASFFLGEEPHTDTIRLDAADLLLIEELQRDGRTPYAALAEASGLSVSGARTRVTRLLESGAMQIGAIRGNRGERGELTVGLGITAPGDHAALVEALQRAPGLQFLARTIGRYDLVATVGVPSLPRLHELLTELREVAPGLGIEQWVHARIHLERYHRHRSEVRGEQAPSP